MNPYASCPDCGGRMKPSSQRCYRCEYRVQRQSGKHRETIDSRLKAMPERQARIRLYAERAGLGLPLFAERGKR